MSLEIRAARSDTELEQVYRLRYRAYVERLGHPMRAADHSRRMLRDELDDHSNNIVAVRDGAVIAAVRLTMHSSRGFGEYVHLYNLPALEPFFPEHVSVTTRLVLDDAQSVPIMTAILRHGFARYVANKVCFDAIDCDPSHIALFQRFGYRQIQPMIVHPDGGPHIPLVLCLNDRAHLERIRSPFRSVRSVWTDDAGSVPFFKSLLAAWRAQSTSAPVSRHGAIANDCTC